MTAPDGAPPDGRIPALVNPTSGTAADARAAVEADARFALREVPPERLAGEVRTLAAAGARRILVSGGDGTVAGAASAAREAGIELAILPGGTLNHFARDLGLPCDDLPACLEIAATGTPRRMDLAEVNGRAILNTSSLGAYVDFVRTRERLERWLGYHVASALAALRVWLRVHALHVEVRAVEHPATDEGALAPADASGMRRYRTSLFFLGVGERTLAERVPGARVPEGRRVLHVLVVRETTRARVAALAWSALRRGLDAATCTDALDALLVEECLVRLHRSHVHVAIDGEVVRLESPLRYRLVRDAFTVVAPRDAGDG